MRLEIEDAARRPEVRRHIEQRTLAELTRYGGYVDEVRMRVTERACSSEHPFRCGIAVTIAHDDGGRTHVGTAADGRDAFRAIDSAVAKASSAVGEEIARGLLAQEEAGVLPSPRRAMRRLAMCHDN
jgi:hypothetical protein